MKTLLLLLHQIAPFRLQYNLEVYLHAYIKERAAYMPTLRNVDVISIAGADCFSLGRSQGAVCRAREG